MFISMLIRSIAYSLVMFSCCVAAHVASAQVSAQTFVKIGGDSFQGTITSIDENGLIAGGNLPEGLTLETLREIRTGKAVADTTPALIVHFAGGDLFADAITIEEEVCRITSSAGEFEFGIESIRGVRLKPDKPLTTFDTALQDPLEAGDQIFVEVDGQFQKLEGLVAAFDARNISLEYRGKSRTLPSDRIYGFVMAGIGEETERKIDADITLTNGSRLSGKIKSLKDGVLQANFGILADIDLPWNSIARISVRSERLAFLSDLNPRQTEQKSLIITVPRPWQRNLSIAGNPLTLLSESESGQTVYSSGLGTHSGCRLVFGNDGQFNTFTAVIGIDVETNRHGDCVFIVLGDGRELLSQRMTGTDTGKEIALDISEVAEVTLLVEPGENLDLADHADWCEARFLKTE